MTSTRSSGSESRSFWTIVRRLPAVDGGRAARGGHWVVVGRDAARDESGEIVGKGDMGAQLEQVGEKVETGLKAAGASLSDIIKTRTYVVNPDQLASGSNISTELRRPECVAFP